MAAALGVLLGAPTLAQAQQSGLFPLAPIRRERVPCAVEDPVYRLYRQEYFGYHPTCWRRFPTGWGCPSPEAPNAAEAFRLLPRDEPPPGFDDEEGGPGMGPGPDGREAPGRTPRDGQPAPNNLPPLPSGERSPFELDQPTELPPAGTNPGRTPGASLPPRPAAREDAEATPDLAPSADLEQPLLALPDPTVSPTSDTVEELPTAVAPSPRTPLYSQPAQAPRRQGLLGRLFNGRVLRR